VDDLPIFIVPGVLHLSDIAYTIIGGITEILWIVLLASAAQAALLGIVRFNNRWSTLEPQRALSAG
jgi:hypothetical protein